MSIADCFSIKISSKIWTDNVSFGIILSCRVVGGRLDGWNWRECENRLKTVKALPFSLSLFFLSLSFSFPSSLSFFLSFFLFPFLSLSFSLSFLFCSLPKSKHLLEVNWGPPAHCVSVEEEKKLKTKNKKPKNNSLVIQVIHIRGVD